MIYLSLYPVQYLKPFLARETLLGNIILTLSTLLMSVVYLE